MKRLSVIGICLVIALTACLPSIGNPTSQGDQNTGGDSVDAIVAATFAAQTAEAQAAAAQAAAAQTATAQAQVNATANQNANCRSGPGTEYDILAVFDNGSNATVTGKYDGASGLWYQVELANGTTCWVAESVVGVTGDTSTVVFLNAPPTPTAKPVPSWVGTWNMYQSIPGGWTQNFTVTMDANSEGQITFHWTTLAPWNSTYYATGTPSSDGMRLEGFAQTSGGTDKITFVFVRNANNLNQFSGRWRHPSSGNNDGDWCGYMNGVGLPSPCRGG